MSFPDNLPVHWRSRLAQQAKYPYFLALQNRLRLEHQQKKNIFPPKSQILQALQDVDYPDVKVVILGQDPYHGPGQAIGRSFAVPNTIFPKPPSLMNIFKELSSDLGITLDLRESDLSGWAKQGVLLLNTVLTVRAKEPLSHRNIGWENFTDKIISELNQHEHPLVFILWGSAAHSKKMLLDRRHACIMSAHPSPLSAYRGFFGSKPFSKANDFLIKINRKPIDWSKVCSI